MWWCFVTVMATLHYNVDKQGRFRIGEKHTEAQWNLELLHTISPLQFGTSVRRFSVLLSQGISRCRSAKALIS